jgi:predicted nuclease with RNAse H fold
LAQQSLDNEAWLNNDAWLNIEALIASLTIVIYSHGRKHGKGLGQSGHLVLIFLYFLHPFCGCFAPPGKI